MMLFEVSMQAAHGKGAAPRLFLRTRTISRHQIGILLPKIRAKESSPFPPSDLPPIKYLHKYLF